MSLKYEELTGNIIKAFYNVYNKLGYGFLERVYENAMVIELKKQGISTVKQKPINVYYDEELVGNYFAGLAVEDKVIVELKAATRLIAQHDAQLLNYLKATEIEVGLLLNFGPKPEFSRKFFENHLK